MPNKGVASDLLAMGVGEGDERVGAPPPELPAHRLDRLPFHRVLGGDAGQLGRREFAIRLLVEGVGIERRAEIAAARRRGGTERHFARLGGVQGARQRQGYGDPCSRSKLHSDPIVIRRTRG